MEHFLATSIAGFTDLLLDAVCLVDGAGRFVFVSAACERIFGYTQQEMVGQAMIDLVAPADRARTLGAARAVMDGRPHADFENRYVRKDGSLVWLRWSARWSEADQLRVAIAHDITDLRTAQQRQAALYAISEAAHATDDLAALFARCHTIIGSLVPAHGFAIVLRDAVRGQRDVVYDADAGAALALHLYAEVLRSGDCSATDGAWPPPGAAPSLPGAAPPSPGAVNGNAVGVPLSGADGTIGVLVCTSGAGGAAYSAADRALLVFLASQLAATIERKQLQAQMRYMAMHDELTQLPNRRLFHDRLETAFARAERQKTRLALLFIDLNRFKQVNDHYGHVCGDRLLQEVARRVSACVRGADTLARLGGDEFVVLLESVVLQADVALVVEKVHDALTEPVDLGEGVLYQVTASVGVAHFPDDGTDMQSLLARADAAMYRAKATLAASPG